MPSGSTRKRCGVCLFTYHDVATAVEFAIDVHLWERGPLAVLLHATPKPLIFEDVDCLVRHVQGVQDLHTCVGEATLPGSPGANSVPL